MRKFHISILILIVILPLSYAFSDEITSLSKKASKLKVGMSRQVTMKLLGHPTWAVIPGDKGDFTLPDPRIALELHWRNSSCSPVVVQFNSAHKVIGWDEGRAFCGKDAHLFEPSNEYICDKSDRAKFCK